MIEARLEEIDTGALSFLDIAEYFSSNPQWRCSRRAAARIQLSCIPVLSHGRV